MIADRNYYADGKGNLAKSGKDAAYLLAVKGQEIPESIAKAYGIGNAKPRPAENKATVPSVEFKVPAKAEQAVDIPATASIEPETEEPKKKPAPKRKPRKK